jgi:hypothetical protein
VNRLQKALINSHIAPKVSRLNCQKNIFFKCEHIIFLTILIEIFIVKRTKYHKYTLTSTYQKLKKKKFKTLLSSMINLSSVKSTPRSLFGLFIKKNLRSEIQNSLTNSGLPIHKLELKVNCIVLPTTCKIVAWA